jgi:hypothetical protein
MVKMVLLAVGLVLFTAGFAAEEIKLPANWGSKFLLGVSNDQANATSLKTPQTEGVGAFYHYRNVSAREVKFDASGNVDTEAGLILQIKNSFIASGDEAGATPSLMLEYFSGTGVTPDKEELLKKFNNRDTVKAYFKIIKALGNELKSKSKMVVIVEPDTWSTIMQAKFHFFDSTHSEYGKQYKNILDFPARVKQGELGLGAGFEYLNDYPNTVAGLANALVRAVRVEFNNPNVGMTISTWAAFAKGCSKNADINELNNGIFNGSIRVKGVDGIQTWADEDIKISAFSNVHFYREMFDELNVSDAIKAQSKPDFFGINKSPLDAGYVKYYGDYDALIDEVAVKRGTQGKKSNEIEGSGSDIFYWNQEGYDKWLDFAEYFSHGIQLPLVAIKMPVGHLGLKNQAFEYEDTFSNWLFNKNGKSVEGSVNSGSEFVWKANNFERFKKAGFIGLWIGRDGWPAYGTQYGQIEGDVFTSSQLDEAGNNDTEFGNAYEYRNYFKKNGNVYIPQNTGDAGWFINNFKNQNREISAIPVTFDQAEFEATTGACSVPSDGASLGDVDLLPGSLINGKSTDGLYTTPTGADNGSDETKVIPDVVLKNGLKTLEYERDSTGKFTIIGVVGDMDEAEKNTLIEYYNNTMNTDVGVAGLSIEVKYGLGEKGEIDDYSTFPEFAYRWYIFDMNGQYINSEIAVIKNTDLEKYLKIELDAEKGTYEAVLRFMSVFNKRSVDGRKLGSGVYYWKGYIEERNGKKFLKINSGGNVAKDDNGNQIFDFRKTENQVINKKIGLVRE